MSTINANAACDFRDSILRNSIFGLLVAAFYLIGWIPYFGKLVVFVVGLLVVAYEASLLYKAPRLYPRRRYARRDDGSGIRAGGSARRNDPVRIKRLTSPS